ncbi:hypothetical protein SEA_RAWRGERTHAT_87 [Mycobacterium phage RawrgerThat]|nr:hypothetical protein SEA_RAWRGERTHAT_87 [Mycobacterium phage RawrgerThat]
MAGAEPKYPDVHVQLTGQDGNVFFIIGKVSKALREAGHVDQVTEFVNEVTDTDSYDAALAVVMQWVEVS